MRSLSVVALLLLSALTFTAYYRPDVGVRLRTASSLRIVPHEEVRSEYGYLQGRRRRSARGRRFEGTLGDLVLLKRALSGVLWEFDYACLDALYVGVDLPVALLPDGRLLVEPEIMAHSEEEEAVKELNLDGSLSYVTRRSWIVVAWRDERGSRHVERIGGETGFCLQKVVLT